MTFFSFHWQEKEHRLLGDLLKNPELPQNQESKEGKKSEQESLVAQLLGAKNPEELQKGLDQGRTNRVNQVAKDTGSLNSRLANTDATIARLEVDARATKTAKMNNAIGDETATDLGKIVTGGLAPETRTNTATRMKNVEQEVGTLPNAPNAKSAAGEVQNLPPKDIKPESPDQRHV